MPAESGRRVQRQHFARIARGHLGKRGAHGLEPAGGMGGRRKALLRGGVVVRARDARARLDIHAKVAQFHRRPGAGTVSQH